MNCYLCFLETHNPSRPAFGICHTCGVGICECHLIVVTVQSISGMATQILPSRRLYCSHCHKEEPISRDPSPTIPRTPQEQRSRSSWRGWWQRLNGKREYALPEPEEAITLVEQYLKQQQQTPEEKCDG